MTIDQALAWLRELPEENMWSEDFGDTMYKVLPQLIGVVEASDGFTDNDYETVMGWRSSGDVKRLRDALMALAEACEKESK